MYVPCRRVCDLDQNEIKRSKPFWELIKVASELWNSIHQGCVAPIWPIKSFRRKRSSNQDFLQTKPLDPSCKRFNRRACKWLPLDIASYPSSSREKQGAGMDTLSNLSSKMTVQLYSCYLSMMKDQQNSTVSMHQCSIVTDYGFNLPLYICIHTLNTHTQWYHIAHVLTHTAQWW